MAKQHPILQRAKMIIWTAAELLEGEGFSRRSDCREPYGIPEAIAEATQLSEASAVARVVAERQLVHHGIDVWWNDLLCVDGDHAARELRRLAAIDGELLYGEQWEAQLGLLIVASQCDAAKINGLGNLMGTTEWTAFETATAIAAAHGRELLLLHVCEDVNFVVPHSASTPAGLNRRLRGIRALECVAAQQVLFDVLSPAMSAALVRPVVEMLIPFKAIV